MVNYQIKGKYCTAIVFTDNIEQEAISQITGLLNQEFSKGATVAIMPDVHAGKGCTVGTTMTVTDRIVPNLVGVDLGCGMYCIKFQKGVTINPADLDDFIKDNIPSGKRHRDTVSQSAIHFDMSKVIAPFDVDVALKSLGSLGGGNHFIELDKDDEGYLYLVIHSGSRHFGLEVANYYIKKAEEYTKAKHENNLLPGIEELKRQGRQSEIPDYIKANKLTPVPKDLSYLEGNLMEHYLHDVGIAQEYARLNRIIMANQIIERFNLKTDIAESFHTIHNYIDLNRMILRKGAISLNYGERAIIPMNMRDGSLIVVGKGNPDWNYSGPHGAGRVMSRKKAKEVLDLDEYKKSMAGIYTTSVDFNTIDEAPMVYKSIDEIIENIQPTCDVVKVIKPIYNFKAGGE